MTGMDGQATTLAEGYTFLEGPRWRDGRLYASDFYSHRVLAFAPDGSAETVCEVPGQPSGLGWAPDGSLLVVSMLEQRVMRFDGEALTELADVSPYVDGPCNDMTVDAAGRAYVGNFGFDPTPDAGEPLASTNLVVVEPDGSCRVAASGLTFPNGIVISPDGRSMYVAETFAGRISRFDVRPDGALTNRSAWAQFAPRRAFPDVKEALASGCLLPDGMAGDAQGALWVADANGHGAVRVRDGQVVDRVGSGGLSVYAVALGGDDGRTLFMCAAPPFSVLDGSPPGSSCLLSCEVAVPGAGLPGPGDRPVAAEADRGGRR